MVQLDETYLDATKRFARMGFDPDVERFHFMWDFSPMAFPELRQKVEKTGTKVVVIDSLLRTGHRVQLWPPGVDTASPASPPCAEAQLSSGR